MKKYYLFFIMSILFAFFPTIANGEIKSITEIEKIDVWDEYIKSENGREIHIQIQRPRVTPVKIRLHHILLDIHSHGRIITDFFRSSRHAHRVRRRKRIPRQQLKPIRVLLS